MPSAKGKRRKQSGRGVRISFKPKSWKKKKKAPRPRTQKGTSLAAMPLAYWNAARRLALSLTGRRRKQKGGVLMQLFKPHNVAKYTLGRRNDAWW